MRALFLAAAVTLLAPISAEARGAPPVRRPTCGRGRTRPPDSLREARGAPPVRLAEEMLAEPKVESAGAMHLYGYAFAAYALSNTAQSDADLQPRCAELLDRLIERALDPALSQPFHAGFVEVEGRRISRSVALRGHLALMLIARRRIPVPMSRAEDALMRRVIGGLAEDIEAKPSHLLPSYGKRAWAADNEVARAALALYAEHVDPEDRAVARALASMARSLAAIERTGPHALPPSEVDPEFAQARDVPRGCALSWTVIMRGLWDGGEARALYARYRRAYWVDYTLVQGFREWPPGVDRRADFDSGPIVMGIGVAASGLGLGAARIAGAQEDYAALEGSANLAGIRAVERMGGAYGRMVRAIALYGRSARPWR